MKKLLLLIFVTCILSACGFSQTKHPASAAGGAPAPGSTAAGGAASTSASASNSQTGFVYYLKYKWHMQFASTRSEIYYFTKSQTVEFPEIMEMFDCDVDTVKLIKATFTLDRKANSNKWIGVPSFKEYDLRPLSKQFICSKAEASPLCIPSDDTVLIATIIYNDSIPRYWNIERNALFDKPRRLRLAIVQDSAILKANVYYDNFVNDATGNPADITNPNKVYIGEVPSELKQRAIQPNGYVGLHYDEILDKYKKSVADYEETLFKKFKANNKDRTLALADTAVILKFRDVEANYEAADLKYDEVTAVKKQQLDDLEDKINDPALVKDTTGNRIKFLNALYALNNDQNMQPPPKKPTNMIDQNITEKAIPLSGMDSAQDLYFKIYHKSRSNQPFYFMPFHYGTWDYGSLTAPFRYRFAQAKEYIFTQQGKDVSAPVPEESDAQINLSAYFGRKWGCTKFYEDPSKTVNLTSFEATLIAGPTLIPLSLSNVDSNSKYVGAANNYSYTGPGNIIAISVGAGIVAQWKTVNLGLFFGWDIPVTAETGWAYANKPWLAFGIGVNLGMLSSGNP